MDQVIFFLDKIGIFAFAFVGVTHGVRKKLDIFGLILIGVITAIGGGMLRDISLARTPYAISHIDYMLTAITASIFSIIFYHLDLKVPLKLVVGADTLGLAAFAVSGANVAVGSNLNVFVVILFSVITASGGGLLRDIVLNEIPFILKREIYATAAGIGGVLFYMFFILGYGYQVASAIAMILIIITRSYAIKKKLHLPRLT